jgi:hypothetical protein
MPSRRRRKEASPIRRRRFVLCLCLSVVELPAMIVSSVLGVSEHKFGVRFVF